MNPGVKGGGWLAETSGHVVRGAIELGTEEQSGVFEVLKRREESSAPLKGFSHTHFPHVVTVIMGFRDNLFIL